MIQVSTPHREYEFPNSWEELTPEQFIALARHLQAYSLGQESVGEVRVRWLCDISGIDPSRFPARSRDMGMENLFRISRQLTFMFEIRYPDGVLEQIQDMDMEMLRKLPPDELPPSPQARYLARQDYRYTLDAVFAKNLIPEITVGRERMKGWEVLTHLDTITSDITALQFIEASKVLERIAHSRDLSLHPLLASILYAPRPYNSALAHRRASEYAVLDPAILQAVSLNFQALISWLFTRTQFSILRQSKVKKQSSIRTGMHEMLYNLSSDGLGDASDIEQMELVKFLLILRKKLIESVRALHDFKKKAHEIAEETDLPIDIINKILFP
jgi:hypothetical protein